MPVTASWGLVKGRGGFRHVRTSPPGRWDVQRTDVPALNVCLSCARIWAAAGDGGS